MPFQLRAYKRIAFDDTYHAHNMLFNPSKVKKFILHFLVAHKQCNAYVSFCTINSAMSEQYISLQTTDSQSHEFGMKNTSIVTWKYQHLYQHDGQSIFYAYGIPRSLVLQYQLLAVNTHLNLIAIRTPHSALFTLYTFLYGVAFRKTQYALDMIKNENQPERLISMEMIRRTIALPIGFPLKEESRHIAIACGLCIAAEEES